MMSVAAGLALNGKTVYVYSIANFITFRCLEQIRNDGCYHQTGEDYQVVGSLENTDRIMRDSFWIGVYPGMRDEMINLMARCISEGIKK